MPIPNKSQDTIVRTYKIGKLDKLSYQNNLLEILKTIMASGTLKYKMISNELFRNSLSRVLLHVQFIFFIIKEGLRSKILEYEADYSKLKPNPH